MVEKSRAYPLAERSANKPGSNPGWLRGIFEELITPILYAVPDDATIRSVEIESLFTEPRFIRKP